jgi:hypothetical protein
MFVVGCGISPLQGSELEYRTFYTEKISLGLSTFLLLDR